MQNTSHEGRIASIETLLKEHASAISETRSDIKHIRSVVDKAAGLYLAVSAIGASVIGGVVAVLASMVSGAHK